MTMTRLVILANSWKHSDWCIAGIDLATGQWVRPVTQLTDGRIPKGAMQLDGYFPQLRDVVELPLADTGPGYGFEKENKTLLPGKWRRHEKVAPEVLMSYAHRPAFVLHTPGISVPVELLRKKPPEERHSLELIHTDAFRARRACSRATGAPTWQGVFPMGNCELAIRITDPVLVGKLNAGYRPASSCLLTMSLSMPYKPPDWSAERSEACWKLIAGVIELPLSLG